VLRAVLGGVRFGAEKTARGAGFRCLLLGRQPARERATVGRERPRVQVAAGHGVLTATFSRLRRYLLPPMFTARTKIVKDRADQEPTELEDDVAKALFELQEQVGAPT
jgi:hypothetical protein